MTIRSAVIKLTADASNAIKAADDTGDAYERAGKRITKAGIDQDKAWQMAGRTGRNVALGGVAVLGAVAKANITFDKAMSGVSAATMASERDLGRLRKASIEAGADTQFSATEAAKGVTELAKAGIDTGEILGGGLRGALSLAAAGQIEVADAAEIAASSMTQFKLGGKDVTRIADLLAAGAGKAQGGVKDLGMALGQVGLVSAGTGLSIDETVGGLTAFASAGLLGSDAGTSFKTMLMSLNPRSKEAAVLMDQYNLRAYDAQGNFIGLAEYAGKLRDGLSGMSDEQRNATLQTIFGSDAIRAARELYNQGEKGIESWTKKVQDQGYASETAAKQTDNLAGDIERFTGSLESAFINGGSGAQAGLRDMVQGGEDLVDKFNELPESVQSNSVKAVAALTATGGLLWAVAKVKNTISDLRVGGRGGVGAGVKVADAMTSNRVVPVFVTNPGFDGPDGPGRGAGGRGGTTVVGAPGRAPDKSSKPRRLPGGAVVAEAVLFAGPVLKGLDAIGSKLDDIGTKGPETGSKLFKSFEKPKGGVAKFFFGEADTLQKDIDTTLGALKFDGIFAGIEKAGGDLIGGTSFTRSLDRIDELDQRLADLQDRDPSAALATFNDIIDKTGVSADDLSRALPKTAAAMRDAAVGGNVFAAQLAINTATSQAYSRVLRGMPEQVVTEVQAKGTDLSRADVRGLQREYDLTPREVQTLLGLVGDGPTRQRLRAVQAQLAETGAAKALPFVGQRGAQATAREIQDVLGRINVLDRSNARPQIQQQGAPAALVQIGNVRSGLAALNGYTANTFIRTTRLTGGVVGGPRPAAGGATVPDTGLGYADRHLYLLADLEEVVSNRTGQASRYRRTLKAINADLPREQIKATLAGGGTTGAVLGLAGGGTTRRTTKAKTKKKTPGYILTRPERREAVRDFDIGKLDLDDTKRELVDFASDVRQAGGRVGKDFDGLSKRIIKNAGEYEKLSTKLEDVRAKQDSAREAGRSAFDGDIFNGTLADLRLQLTADRNDANAAREAAALAQGRGLETDFAAGLAGSGNVALAQEIARLSAREVSALQSMYAQRSASQNSLGAQAASAFTPVVTSIEQTMADVTRRLEGLEDAVERGARNGVEGKTRAATTKTKARGR